jgi:hypothetical protein
MNAKATLKLLAWLLVSVAGWLSTLIVVQGKYPDWDDAVAYRICWFIRVALICAWGLRIFSNGHDRLIVWFKCGVLLSISLCLVRLFFLRELIALLKALKL